MEVYDHVDELLENVTYVLIEGTVVLIHMSAGYILISIAHIGDYHLGHLTAWVG